MTAPETPLPSPPGMKITEENKLKGSLFIEAYGSLIDGISKDAESETEKALDITFNAIGAASATVMLAIDPLGSIIGAGVGWLIEHVSFLRDALNQLMGNPEEIQANVEATKARAAELRVLAEDHKNGLATFDGWTGQSSERFKTSMDGMYQELDELASAVETKAKIVAIMGMLVTVLRDIVRDLIAQLIGSLIGGAILAAAAMIPTFGASIPIFCGFAVGKAVALGTNIASRVARVVAALGRQMKRIGDLDDIMAKISKGWQRFENVADVAEIGYEAWKAQRDVDKKIDEAVANNQSGGGAAPEGTSGLKTGQDGVAPSAFKAATAQQDAVAPTGFRVGTVQQDATAPTGFLAPTARQDAVPPTGFLAPTARQDAVAPTGFLAPTARQDAVAPTGFLAPTARQDAVAPTAFERPHLAPAQMDSLAEPAQPRRMMNAVEPMQPMYRTEPAEPMQALKRTDAAEPMQPLQPLHRAEPAQLIQPMYRAEAPQAPQPFQAPHRMDAPEAPVAFSRTERPEAPVAFSRVEASDSTMTSGVSMTAGAPVHEALQPTQAREMYSSYEAPSEPAQPMHAGYEPMARTQMSHTFEALEPRESYNPLVEHAAFSTTPVEENLNPLQSYDNASQAGGAAAQPLRPTVAHERPTRPSQ